MKTTSFKMKKTVRKLPSTELIMGPPPEVNPHQDHPDEFLPESKAGTQNLTLSERFDIFMNETSFTALTRIHKATSIFKKIIWIFVVLAFLGWLSLQCYWLFSKFFSYPVEVKIEYKSKPQLDFPSVTICNRNPLKQSKVKGSPFESMSDIFVLKHDDSMYDTALKMFKEQEGIDDDDSSSNTTFTMMSTNSSSGPSNGTGFGGSPDMMSMMKEKGFNPWDALNNLTKATEFYQTQDQECSASIAYSGHAVKLEEDVVKQYGHQIKKLLTHCKFASMQCSPQNFTYEYNSKYGNCYTFNHFRSENPKVVSTYAGALMGLVMEFNIEQHEYISALSPDAGVRVLVHERGTYPFPEDTGITISPGMITSIGLKQIRHSRLPPPHADCANEGAIEDDYKTKFGTSYSKKTCLKSCYQKLLRTNCKCVFPFFLTKSDDNICDMMDPVTSACAMASTNENEYCNNVCPSECEEVKYEYAVSSGLWPSEIYQDELKYRIEKTSTDFMKGDDDDDDGPSVDDNLVKLEIYFTELGYEYVQQQKAYESINLISDVGGQLGLWLGLSAITVGEIMEFFAAIFKAATARAVKRVHVHNNQKTPVEKFTG